jgi:hypothetical protein
MHGLSCVSLLLAASTVAAQGQSIVFSFGGPASGQNVHGTTSGFGVRAGGAGGSHAVVVPLAAGMNEPQLAPTLIPAAAAQQIGLTLTASSPSVGAFTLASVDGASPSRGCLVGTDDTAITSLVGEIGGGGTSRFFGAAIPKASTAAPANGVLTVEVVGRSTTDGHLFGVTSQLQVAAGESAASLNQRLRTDLLAKGCSVFDIAMPSFTSATATIPGFGVDRFDGLVGSQVGHQFRVGKVFLGRSGGAQALRGVIGLGWFPTGGFAEYGTGFAAVGPEPHASGSGDFAPGGAYDVTLAWGRPELGVLLGATARGATALPGGASLLLDPAAVVAAVPFATDAHGRAVVTRSTPATPATLGQTLHWQGIALRAGTLAATSGVYVRIWQ